MSYSAQDVKDREQFLAAVAVAIANLGNPDIMWEFVAQFIASMLLCGDPTASELAEIDEAISGRVHRLLLDAGSIWPELMPGPTRDDEAWEAMLNRVDAIMNDRLDELAGELLLDRDDAKHPNIKLDYPVTLRRTINTSETEALNADACEFFMDEHGWQWVKFTPRNGYGAGRETMWRTDQQGFSVERR